MTKNKTPISRFDILQAHYVVLYKMIKHLKTLKQPSLILKETIKILEKAKSKLFASMQNEGFRIGVTSENTSKNALKQP